MHQSLVSDVMSDEMNDSGELTLFYHSISPRGLQWRWKQAHDNRMSKQFVNNVASVAILATCWHEVPLPPLEGQCHQLKDSRSKCLKNAIGFSRNAY